MSIDQHHSSPTGDRLQRFSTLSEASRQVLGISLKILVVAGFVFSAVFLGLRYFVVPHIANYKHDIEAMATRAIGGKVTISAIDASWDGLRPSLVLDKVVIYDKAGKEALRLPKASATVSWLSMFVGEVRLHRLEIDRPEMEMTRDAQGKLYIGGIFFNTQKRGDTKAADWILSQAEIAIRDGKLRWKDDMRGAPLLALDGVDVLLRNQWRHHQFTLKATPPAELAAPLDVRAFFDHPRFTRTIADPMRWKGEIYVDLQKTDLAVWKPYFDYPIEIGQGKGAVRAWLTFDHAKVANFTADLSLENVSARLRKDLQALNLAQVNGRVSIRESFNPESEDGTPTFGLYGHAISLTNFSLQTYDGLNLSSATISETYTPAAHGQPQKTSLAANLLDLKTVAELAERLPLSADQHRLLTDFEPRGVLKDFSMQWQGDYPQVFSYAVKGRFEALSLRPQVPRPAIPKSGKLPAQAAIPGIPGFENLTGSVNASDKGGNFQLESENLKLQFPGYFGEPDIPFDRLNMAANWAFQSGDKLLLDVRGLDFVQNGLSGTLRGTHLMPLNRQAGASPGIINVSGTLNGLEATKVGNFLPSSTPQRLREWLGGALVAGVADDVRVKLRGDLADFPFHTHSAGEKPRGEFLVTGKIRSGALDYTPGHFAKDGKSPMWPLLEDVNGTITFDRTRMEIHGDSAKTYGTALSNVKAVIDDLSAHEMSLQIAGDAAGSLSDMVGYVNASPVADMIGHFTEETKATGNAKLALKLELPLDHLPETKVNGTLQFLNNNVTLFSLLPTLSATNGKLEFHENGFNVNGIRSNFVGGPVSLSGGMSKDGQVSVRAEGIVTSTGLRRTYPAPAMQRLADRIAGNARYVTSIRVKNRSPEIVVESNLAGVAIDFPAPLRKAANEVLPLKVELLNLPSNDPSVVRDEMRIALGSMVSARYERQKTMEKGADWRVMRGGIGVNVPAPVPDSGLGANINLKSLNLDEWGNALLPLLSVATDSDRDGGGPDVSQYIVPELWAARAGEMGVLGKKLDNVVLGASHQKGVWQVNVEAEQASGYLTWNESRSGRGLGKVTARLASLSIPKGAASDVGDLLNSKSETAQIPALDIIAENFELFGKKFGRMELAANHARGVAGREWRISKLAIVNADAEFHATGTWAKPGNESVSSLAYSLNIADGGRLLDRLGFANVLRGGKGKMEGELNWKGVPFSLDIPTMSGNLQLELASGQFLKVDPSAAKLLGVLNMQALPRRLALDFRDVFSEGFAFDGVVGTATITQGMVKTDSFKMRGVAATVLIDGTADVARESQNLHVSVIPEINVGAASVVYGLAVNPVIGVGTFLAQMFLRDPLMKAFTFEYQVTGPWKDPVVTKLMRKTPNPTGDVAAELDKPG